MRSEVELAPALAPVELVAAAPMLEPTAVVPVPAVPTAACTDVFSKVASAWTRVAPVATPPVVSALSPVTLVAVLVFCVVDHLVESPLIVSFGPVVSIESTAPAVLAAYAVVADSSRPPVPARVDSASPCVDATTTPSSVVVISSPLVVDSASIVVWREVALTADIDVGFWEFRTCVETTFGVVVVVAVAEVSGGCEVTTGVGPSLLSVPVLSRKVCDGETLEVAASA